MVTRVHAIIIAVLATGCFIEPDPPTGVDPNTAAGHLAAGGSHACAIDHAGVLFCWGDDLHRQLGRTLSPLYSGTPTPVDSNTWDNVAAGISHTCAVRNGTVFCWGANGFGQCGVQAGGDLEPTEVPLLHDIDRVFAGGYGSCAIDTSKQLWCWGLADLSTTPFAEPTQVTPGGLTAWASVALSGTHACALADSGDVYCWGDNESLELGSVTAANPTPLDGAVHKADALFTAVGVADSGTCAVQRTGELACWGAEAFTTTTSASAYTVVDTKQLWTAVAPSPDENCGIRDGNVLCYGFRVDGISGTFDAHPSLGTSILGNVVDVVAGDGFACARAADDTVQCWGANTSGELGNGEVATQRTPFKLGFKSNALALGDTHTCALELSASTPRCWGDNRTHQVDASATKYLPDPVPRAEVLLDLAAGSNHTCGRAISQNAIQCWGENTNLQSQTQTSQGPAYVTVAAGGNASCATDENLDAYCWGDIPGTAMGSVVIPQTAQIALGADFAVAISGLSQFAVVEFGHECSFGTAPESSPNGVSMTSSGSSALVATATTHACMYGLAPPDIKCWGSNYYHESSATTSDCADPNVIPRAPNGWAAPAPASPRVLSVGGNHSCAISAIGELLCWGYNGDHALGDLQESVMTPTKVNTSTWRQVVTGPHHTCAIADDDEVYCWGLNRLGEVGNGLRFHDTPQLVTF